METIIERQRKNRLIEGHPSRISMIEWNKSEKGKNARKKYDATESAKKIRYVYTSGGGNGYEAKQKRREKFIKQANNSRRKWTAEQTQALRILLDLNCAASEIAKSLGRSLQSIEHKRALLKKCVP